jgi:hypothetical protein
MAFTGNETHPPRKKEKVLSITNAEERILITTSSLLFSPLVVVEQAIV